MREVAKPKARPRAGSTRVTLPRALALRGFLLVEERAVFDRPGTYQYTFPRGSRNFVVDLWGAGSGGAGNPFIAFVIPGVPLVETAIAIPQSGGGGGAHVTGTAVAPAGEGPDVTVRVVVGTGGAGGSPVQGAGGPFPPLAPIGGKAGGASSVTFVRTGEQFTAGGGLGMTVGITDSTVFLVPTDPARGGVFTIPPSQPLLVGTPGQGGERALNRLSIVGFGLGGSGGAASQGGPGGHGGGSILRAGGEVPAETDPLTLAGRAGIAPGGGGGGAGALELSGTEVSHAWLGPSGGAGADGRLAIKYLRLVTP